MTRFLGILLAFTLLTACGASEEPAPVREATLIDNVIVIDGTGAPGVEGAIRVVDGVIIAVGDLAPEPGDTVIDGGGRVLAPGFIDTHSHHDDKIFDWPQMEAAVSQGITTIILGQDGGSTVPLAGFFDKLALTPAAVNVASYSGHASLRRAVMGKGDTERAATAAEITALSALLDADMDAGALGLATGLEYAAAVRSTPEEVVTLAKVAAARGGRYISHVRSEDTYFWEAIEEIIEIGTCAKLPVQISHIKLALVSDWGATDKLIARLDAARAAGVDITADIYPYTYWASTIRVFFPDLDYDNPERARYAITQVSTPEGIRFSWWKPEPALGGMTLAEIADLRGEDPAQVLMDMIRELDAYQQSEGADVGGAELLTAVSMTETDITALMQWPHTNICSDGGSEGGHPRGYGAFTRFFGHYVRDGDIMDLATAIHKATGLAAAHMGIEGRGTLEVGKAADMVLFDPATIQDNASIDDRMALSTGIATVWVNGQVVFADGSTTDARPGAVVRRGD